MRNYLTAIFLLISALVAGQDRIYNEAVRLSVPNTGLIVGETLYFSAFVYETSSRQLSALSSVLYIDLIDQSGSSRKRLKVGLQNGRGAGAVFLPLELETGTYQLIAYTRWMKNFDVFYRQPIAIINPYNNGLTKTEEEKPENPAEKPISATFQKRKSAKLILDDIKPAALSIAIAKTGFSGPGNDILLNQTTVDRSSFDQLPEYKFGLIQGKIQGDNPGNKRVNLSFNGLELQVNSTLTDEYGRFWFDYDPAIAGNIGGIFSNEISTKDIEINNEYYSQLPPFDAEAISLTDQQVEEITKRSVWSQINEAYKNNSTNQKKETENFLPDFSKSYVLSDYTRFPSIRETIIEFIPEVGVGKSESNFKLIVRSEHLNSLTEEYEPLLLIDGLPTDAETLLNMSPNDVERIEVFNKHYFIKDYAFDGIISMHTNNGDFDESNIQGKAFRLADYQANNFKKHVIKLDNEREPLYKTLLYWEPVYQHHGGALVVHFNTSDVEGTYQLRIQGISENGETIDQIKYFRVEK